MTTATKNTQPPKKYTVQEYDLVTPKRLKIIGYYSTMAEAKKAAKESAKGWCEGETPEFFPIIPGITGCAGMADFGAVIINNQR